jgi:outer membrane immunogenic protein
VNASIPGIAVKKFVLALSALAAFTGSALAADMAPRAYTKAPAEIAAVYDWTGFYVGANVGYGWGNSHTNLTSDPALVSPGFITLLGSANAAASNSAGVIGGGQIGYNWQQGQWLAGLEADFSGTNVRSSNNFSGPVGVTRFVHTEQRLDWLATFRGRIGVLAAPQLLLYATGGLAIGQVKTNSSLTTTVANNIPACVAAAVGLCMGSSDTATKVGWTVGGGAEWALTSNWSVKAEYLYVDLGRSNSTGFDTRFTPPLPLFASTKDDFHIARVGVNYRFGGPVVARY